MDNWIKKITLIGVIVAVLVFANEVKLSREAREFESFLTLMNNYNNLVEEKQAAFLSLGLSIQKKIDTSNWFDQTTTKYYQAQ